ncbi:MAG TPA: type I methionyl aminopeptidase [Symbiobacteriaceae bacterium]|nr:type I methionyl aminopeptidase [Symbiobacteriaceae bacterium]
MIKLKSPREIAIMREAGRMVAECHAALAEHVRPGVSTLELDRLVEGWIRQKGAIPSFKGHNGFPGSICVAVNDVICHGIPGKYRLKSGDVLTVDIGAFYKGYHGDSAWTYPVGQVSPLIENLMEITLECLHAGIGAAVAGKRVGDIGHAIQTLAESRGMGVVREFTGHGVGQDLWESPPIPHFGLPGTGTALRSGMVLAIEPMITLGDWRASVDADGWTARTVDGSVCVQYEHTLAITDEGPVVLTEV